jgi:uncharacterized protein (TIGR00251 family)
VPHPWYHWDGDDLILAVHLQPGSAHDTLAGIYADRLKIKVTAVPVDGRANEHLVRYLSELFGVARRQVTLVSGHGSRSKRVRIHRPRSLPSEIEAPLS